MISVEQFTKKYETLNDKKATYIINKENCVFDFTEPFFQLPLTDSTIKNKMNHRLEDCKSIEEFLYHQWYETPKYNLVYDIELSNLNNVKKAEFQVNGNHFEVSSFTNRQPLLNFNITRRYNIIGFMIFRKDINKDFNLLLSFKYKHLPEEEFILHNGSLGKTRIHTRYCTKSLKLKIEYCYQDGQLGKRNISEKWWNELSKDKFLQEDTVFNEEIKETIKKRRDMIKNFLYGNLSLIVQKYIGYK